MICVYIQWFSAKGDFLLRGKLGREAATALQCTGQAFITLICNRERERYDEREKERERERERHGEEEEEGGRAGGILIMQTRTKRVYRLTYRGYFWAVVCRELYISKLNSSVFKFFLL